MAASSVFNIRDFASIAGEMVAALSSLAPDITDYTEGAVARSFLESVAQQLQRLDVAVYQGVREAIEVGTYKNFDFFRLPASYATGTVTVTRPASVSQVTLAADHEFRVPGSQTRAYRTLAPLVLAVGALSGDVAVRCSTAGIAGNTPANTIVDDPNPAFISTVTNAQPFLTGVEQESDADRRARFRLFIGGLSRATKAAIEFAARTVMLTDAAGNALERVTGAGVREPFIEDVGGRLGLVQVFVDNGSGTASQALVDLVSSTIRGYVDAGGVTHKGWIAAGVDLQVFKVVAQPLDVLCQVTVRAGNVKAAVAAAVKAAIEAYLSGLQVFESAVQAQMVEIAMDTPGVADVSFTAPTANVTPGFEKRVVPGDVTVTTA